MLFRSRLSQDQEFFKLFRESSELSLEGARAFRNMVSDLSKSESFTRTIKDYEHRADEVTHRTVALLHKTFITPFDREDVHSLITKMDDILDFIDAAAQRVNFYEIRTSTPELKQLADICITSCELIVKAVRGLDNLKKSNEINSTCIEINRLENDADHVLRSGVAKLFKDEPDTRMLIKLKEIYELLETVTDRCEDVANIIDGIVLEYS